MMQSLSKKKHKALIAALQHLAEMSGEAPSSSLRGGGTTRQSNDGRTAKQNAGCHVILPGNDAFFPAGADLQQLEELFARYQELITELGDCITAYENLYKDLKTNVLGPQFRQIRHRMDDQSLEYHRLKMYFVAARSL